MGPLIEPEGRGSARRTRAYPRTSSIPHKEGRLGKPRKPEARASYPSFKFSVWKQPPGALNVRHSSEALGFCEARRADAAVFSTSTHGMRTRFHKFRSRLIPALTIGDYTGPFLACQGPALAVRRPSGPAQYLGAKPARGRTVSKTRMSGAMPPPTQERPLSVTPDQPQSVYKSTWLVSRLTVDVVRAVISDDSVWTTGDWEPIVSERFAA